MTRACPGAEEWARFLDGEVTANRGDALELHAGECASCRRELDGLRVLIADVATPVAVPDNGVARVMDAIDAAPAPRPRLRWRTAAIAGFAGAVAAAAVAFLVLRSPDQETFRARGGGAAPTLSRNVSITLYANGSPFGERAMVDAETQYQVGYRNLFQDERQHVYLLVFAVDSRAAVHWLFPGFTDPDTDPAAVALSHAPREVLLPETVLLDSPPAGALRILVLLSSEPLQVSMIEALPPAQLGLPALAARWPEAEIREQTAMVATR